MKIGLFFPYSTQQKETASALSLATYFSSSSSIAERPEIYNLTCSGIYSTCDLDSKDAWARKREACFTCKCAQSYVSTKANFINVELSNYLDSNYQEKSQYVLQNLSQKELLAAQFKQIPLDSICQTSFFKRYSKKYTSESTSEEVHFYRTLLLNSLRTFTSISEFIRSEEIELLIVSSADHLISRSALIAASILSCATLGIEVESNSGQVIFRHSAKNAPHISDMLISDIFNVRSNIDSWPEEFLKEISRVAVYVGVESNQIHLPFSKLGAAN